MGQDRGLVLRDIYAQTVRNGAVELEALRLNEVYPYPTPNRFVERAEEKIRMEPCAKGAYVEKTSVPPGFEQIKMPRVVAG